MIIIIIMFKLDSKISLHNPFELDIPIPIPNIIYEFKSTNK